MSKATNSSKAKLYQTCLEEIGQRIATAKKAMEAAEESRDNETKSSVGDKYETSRAMMQGEQERNKIQLINALQQKQELQQINWSIPQDHVQAGSLVQTNFGSYFIAIGLGKIVVDSQTYFVVSPKSPIGRVLLRLKVGDQTSFQNREYLIQKIE